MNTIRIFSVSRWVKTLPLCLFTSLPLFAQTASSLYQPGVTSEGAIYCLPMTAVKVTVQVEKTTYTPGDFCKYSERYLRIKDVSPNPTVSYRITTIRQEPIARPQQPMSGYPTRASCWLLTRSRRHSMYHRNSYLHPVPQASIPVNL